MTEDEIAARVAAQLDDAERRRHADVVIENDGDLAALRSRVEAAWRRLPAAPAPPAERAASALARVRYPDRARNGDTAASSVKSRSRCSTSRSCRNAHAAITQSTDDLTAWPALRAVR